jgi:uncharacterized membrane protein YhiD involved in acid resistance
MDLSYIDVGIRLGAAALAGGMIGINRDLADRPWARGRSGWSRWAPPR